MDPTMPPQPQTGPAPDPQVLAMLQALTGNQAQAGMANDAMQQASLGGAVQGQNQMYGAMMQPPPGGGMPSMTPAPPPIF